MLFGGLFARKVRATRFDCSHNIRTEDNMGKKMLEATRHSIKDGPSDTIGRLGATLAACEGSLCDTFIDVFFAGLLIRTWQTLAHFLSNYRHGPARVHPSPIVRLGRDDLLAAMVTGEVRIAVEHGRTYFQAVLAVHGVAQCRAWADFAMVGIKEMFAIMKDGEHGRFFGHTPLIELCAWATMGYPDNIRLDMPSALQSMAEMETIVFVEEDERITVLFDKILVEPISAGLVEATRLQAY
ncbi:MAG: hypothetical protein US58_C0024G0001 [Candidatus Magasanikbacteria bacterium GW2011_GWA2_37_8]|uniref:Uncharacterized protein n=1 Tax=Candidatus Magasanikbacteria bacterium GW2011_GWA2_37_8 TaxID=1619036 RepID=A0A0G0HN81_9BACT|nr:MAG: hypothetical protein US58_C0024G0001 [Candidatus Magasanikbacteria bacterium GW2011_GWA2_37_8]